MKVLLEGPILTQSGYGEHTRLIFRALKTNHDLDIFVNPLNWGQTSWINYLEEQERKSIDESILNFSKVIKDIKDKKFSFDIHIHVGIINEYSRKGKYSVCVTAGIETDKISKSWVIRTYKESPNKIIFPSNHSKDVFENTTYPEVSDGTPITLAVNSFCDLEVIPYPVKDLETNHIDLNIDTEFNFLSIALDSPRKNIAQMIACFLEEFSEENVGLVIKTAVKCGSLIDRKKTISNLSKIVKKYPDRKCKIYLIHGDLTDSQVHSLYQREDIHAYLSTTRGEGYGLPIFEAAYSGMPIVTTDWSGHLDFLSAPYRQSGKLKNKKLFARIEYDLVEVEKRHLWKGVIEEGSRWAETRPSSVRKQIRKVYENYGMYKKWSESLANHLRETHKESIINDKILKSIIPGAMAQQNINKMQGYEDEIVL